MTLQETLAKLNWGGEGYAPYDGYAKFGDVFNLLGASGQEKTAWNQLGYELSVTNSWMMQQYTEMQNMLRPMAQQLSQMATNPQGFGATALSQMKANLINTVGTQAASQKQQLQQRFASQNLAGLGSGVQQALIASIGQSAAGQEASGLGQIDIANAQAMMQQQQFALAQAPAMAGALGALPQSSQLAYGYTGMENQVAQQYGGMGKQIIGGLIGAGLGAAMPGGALAGAALV